MTIYKLINDMHAKGIELWHEDGQLKLKAPKGALTAELREQLVSNKPDIIAFLKDISATEKNSPILPASRTGADGRVIESFPLSYAQERLWFIDQLEPNSASYNIPGAVTLSGELDIDHLEQAFNAIIARHENLRTIFPSQNGQAQQVILDSLDFTLERIDLSHENSPEIRHQKAQQICRREAETPFNLAKGPLIRGKLIKLTEGERPVPQEYILMLNMHHIISDDWSMGVMIKEFGIIMDSLRQGLSIDQSPGLSPLSIQYVDYSVWQRKLLGEEGVLQQQLEYWQKKLTGVPEKLNLTTDYPRASVQSFEGARQAISLDTQLTHQLRNLAEQQDCTLYMTLLAAFNALLYCYTGEEDICVGSPIANRQYEETESLIGMFVNTLALRSQVVGEASFTSLLAQVKTTCLDAYEHQDTPFEKIVDLVQPGRNMAINPLFQVMFILQNVPEEALDTRIHPYAIEGNSTSKFDLTFELSETPTGIAGGIEYSTALFTPQTIEYMARHFRAICQAIISTPSAKISELEFIDEAEKQQLLIGYNQTQANYQQDKCLHHLFMAQVANHPDKIAVACHGEVLSYQQLYDKSHALALYLQSLGVQPDSLIGLCVERSLEMIVGILGILQAGGAYVPLDPDYPDDRLVYMLQDSQTAIVLTQEKLQDKLADLIPKDIQLIALDRQWSEISESAADLERKQVKLQQAVKPDHLAYVIYTSGSTGQAKGVEVEHAGVVAFLSNPTYVDVTKVNRVASLSSFAFDGFIFDLFLSLSSGSSLFLYQSSDYLQPAQFQKNIQRDEIDTFFVTTALFNQLVENDALRNSRVKQILFGGEKCDLSYVEKLKKHYPDIRLMHVYGPTEAIVYASYCELNNQIDSAPIGKAINNNKLIVMNHGSLLTAHGAIGELYIGGDSLARGYLNRPELTAEKFIPNPYYNADEPNSTARLYRTGDLVRILPDGNLVFIGRNDAQVKIRGFRIELGEIESRIKQHSEIKDSIVIVQDSNSQRDNQQGDKKLIAYYVAKDSKDDLANEDLRAYLRQTLPEYMLPTAFVRLDVMPLTPNGKVDRRALERMDVNLESSQTYLAPRNTTEEQLVAIWAEVLDLAPEKIGVNDNFFELGGHSLLATQLLSRVRAQFDIDVPLKALFEQPGIAGFASLIIETEPGEEQSQTGNRVPPILPVNRIDADGRHIKSFPLSFAQERLWFIDRLEPDNAGYNIPGAVTISGELDIDHLEQAFNLIIARHENLRTFFPSQEGQAQQCILDSLDFKLERHDLSHYQSNEIRHKNARQICQNEAATPFDLACAPLIRGKLLKLTSQEHILMLTMHHIISDGWSMGVMIKEFSLIMDGLRQGQNLEQISDQTLDQIADLPPLPIQYVDYCVWQRKWLGGNVREGLALERQTGEETRLEQQLAYWQEKLNGVPESLELATDYPRSSVQSMSGAIQAFRLDAGLTSQLRSLAEKQGCTLFMTLMAVFKVLLYRYTDQDDICLGSPIANRQYEETESLIGMFVNTLALRSQVAGNESFIDFLAQVQTTCLEAYEHQDTPFEKVVERVQPGRNMAISPLFQVMFILQNAPMESNELHIQSYPLSSNISKFDLTIEFTETGDELAGSIEYRTSLYHQQTIECMTRHFAALCQAITSTPKANISELEFIGETEKQQLLIGYNQTQADYPHDKCIHQLFMAQVANHPDKIAVEYQGEALSYQQLYDKSHALALYLQSQGVKPDSSVGLCVERSLEMMVGILGILQAGGAYVPLDPDYPDDRLVYMLQDSQTTIVLTQEKLQDKLTDLVTKDTQLIALDKQWSEISDSAAELKRKQVNLQNEVGPEHLAYVIYTSGSTGLPKGVMVEHKAVNRLVINSNFIDISKDDTFLQFASLSFDAATFEIWGALLNGAKLVIAPHGKNSLSQLEELIHTNSISVLWLTSGLFQLIVKDNVEQLSNIRVLLSGGDVVPVESTRRFLEHCKNAIFINGYGPTESTTFTTCYVLSNGLNEQLKSLPIGTPIGNTQVYILDQYNNPQPLGVPGELHIAGDGLARGYLNHPELTEEKFIPNPFNPGSRMYKSGDLVRWKGDGNIEYIGRIDTQVKIRGFRIELGEIESRLNEYPEIKDSVVVAQASQGANFQGANLQKTSQQASKNLIAYYVTRDSKKDLVNDDLKAHLQQALPEYMLPTAFVRLDDIPLTPNGKVDRRALERMDVSLESSQTYLAPRNATEERLVAIWAEVLHLTPEKIGVNDNFFELGGHSLLATQLLSRIRSQFAIDLPLKALFEQSRIAGFAPLIVEAQQCEALSQTENRVPPILPVNRTDADGHLIRSFPLSFAQERLWFIDQLEPDSAGYNIPGAVTISGELDADHLDQAFNLIIARHENLRTIFPSQEGQAQQVILNSLDFKLERHDLSHYSSDETCHEQARQLCQTEAATPFDLACGPLIRGKLLKLTAQEHILMLTMHHIISDGWSMGVMIKEFGLIMDGLRQGQNLDQISEHNPDLAPLPIQYLDYSIWQRKWLGSSRSKEEHSREEHSKEELPEQGNAEQATILEQQLAYWQEKLSGVPESLDVATDFPRPSVQNMSGAIQAFNLDAGLTSQLKSLAEKQDCTLFMTLMAAFKVLLYRYTGQEDICLGSPIANRHYEETESLIGMFVNTLALRSQIAGNESFISLLAQVQITCLDAYEHQDTPFEKIVDLVQPGRNMAISPLFQIMFVLQNAPMENVESNEQHIRSYPLNSDISKFDLTLTFTEARDGLEGVIAYRAALYKPETIARMAEHFRAICQAIVNSPTANISDLEFIGEAEKQQLLIDYNQTQADYPQDKGIHQLFMAQVANYPDKIAVIYEGEALSFQQLHDKSHALALYLQSLDVQPDSLIGLCVERSLEMMVGILGILQAGGAYVPLDPDLPDDRLAYMLQDSQVTIVLSQEKLKSKLSALVESETKLIALDQQWSEISDSAVDLKCKQVSLQHELQQKVRPEHLAYVIYTSGSTGQPKGVMIEHKMVIDYSYSVYKKMGLNQCETFASLSTFSADLGNTSIFVPIIFGKTVHLISNRYVNEPIKFKHYLDNHPIDCMKMTPSHFEMFKISDTEIATGSKVLILAGEPLTKEIVDTVNTLNPGCKVFNNYGPTETTIAKLATSELNSSDISSINLGKPLDNTQIYILDRYNKLVPVGVPGELHIAGDGVARGYLHRTELTEEKFIPNPFNRGSRMYKTGDLARWLGDGNIEYLGRIDTQVNIRGFRIETGEIEALLNQYPEIKDCVVIAQGSQLQRDKQLIAYYVARDTREGQIIDLANDDLKTHLQQTLPEYMLPAAFVSLAAIPLTPNGKADRRALENMDVSLESNQVYLAPSNETEKQLVAIWAEVLDLAPEKIGVNDNFFELGGHSLLAVRLMAKINAQFKQSLPLAILFSAPSTVALAKIILSKKESSFDVLVSIQPKGDKPPIFAIPGAGGNVLSFQSLGHALGDDQPFYALQAVGLDGKTPPLDSVEKTAKANITALKSIQPTGPYRLIGHSYGGVVAYEMARILLEQNENVASLTLLDSFAPSVIQKQKAFDEKEMLLEVCSMLANFYGRNVNMEINQLPHASEHISINSHIEGIAEMLIRDGVDITKEQFTTFYNVFKANRRCYLTYQPSKMLHEIDVSLYRADDRHQDNDGQNNESQNRRTMPNDYGWNELLCNSIQIEDVKANHFSILEKKHIQQIVKTMNR